MSRHFKFLLLAFGATALSCASSGASPSSIPGAGFEGEVVFVRFNFGSVDPVSAQAAKNRNVQWVNLAQDVAGQVVFPASIASSFECGSDLAPMYEKVGETYRSLHIEGTMGARVTLPCPLAVGNYDYEIWLYGIGDGMVGGATVPVNKFSAKLIIQ